MGTADTVKPLAAVLEVRGLRLITAESCTGGMIAAACTDLAGSSSWFDRGVVTYSNDAKTELLGVPAATIRRHGAVSEDVARAMAIGAAKLTTKSVALSVTGVAGPTGGNVHKPVGTVCFGFSVDGVVTTCTQHFNGDRAAVRLQSTQFALQELLRLLQALLVANA